MAIMLCRTKGNVSPTGKPRVYFTCHPADFEKYFEKVCEDIFKTHDCVIYYAEDLSAPIAAEDLATDLGSNNLFVIPVTYKLLTQSNRAMDQDFVYAQKEHIPVLPFIMEPGIDVIYSKPDKFGELQYLNPYSTDLTEISYEEKLKKYLDAVLISDETAKQIRAAFDAYIFLSYRKKDRRYANQLMRLIHKNPKCRDIAIWYDEFLTPGESFRDSIDKILHDSKLFTLLVTPNLLEEPDGKPNFVMAEEYPAAKASGIDILPAEMETTDKTALREKFLDIPACVDIRDEQAFHQQFLDALHKIAVTINDADPMHNYLIGLAYLDGIDVEVDRQRGLELITSAAESNLPEAMEKLYTMYNFGTGTKLDYQNAIHWVGRLADHYRHTLGDTHPLTLTALHKMAYVYTSLEDHKSTLPLIQHVYSERRNILGETHIDTILSLNNLANTYSRLGNHKKALELTEQIYTHKCNILGETHPSSLQSLSNLSCLYGFLGDHEKEIKLGKQAYCLLRDTLGKEHYHTMTCVSNLAVAYSDLGDFQRAFLLAKKAYDTHCKMLGPEHPQTLTSMHNLSSHYNDIGDPESALALREKAYALRCQIFGEEHPSTLRSLSALARSYGMVGDLKKEEEVTRKVYALRCKVLGEKASETMISLRNLAHTLRDLKKYREAVILMEQLCALRQEVLGADHPKTIAAQKELARIREKLSTTSE